VFSLSFNSSQTRSGIAVWSKMAAKRRSTCRIFYWNSVVYSRDIM